MASTPQTRRDGMPLVGILLGAIAVLLVLRILRWIVGVVFGILQLAAIIALIWVVVRIFSGPPADD